MQRLKLSLAIVPAALLLTLWSCSEGASVLNKRSGLSSEENASLAMVGNARGSSAAPSQSAPPQPILTVKVLKHDDSESAGVALRWKHGAVDIPHGKSKPVKYWINYDAGSDGNILPCAAGRPTQFMLSDLTGGHPFGSTVKFNLCAQDVHGNFSAEVHGSADIGD